jgi:hypothetical protein
MFADDSRQCGFQICAIPAGGGEGAKERAR